MGAVGHLPIVTRRTLPRYDDREFGITSERLRGRVAFEPFGFALPTAIDKSSEIIERAQAFSDKGAAVRNPYPSICSLARSR